MTNLIDLSGKNAIVTGGSRGVGRATSLLLAEAGANVGISYRNRADEAAATVADLKARGVSAWAEAGDLTDPAAAAALFERGVSEFGGVDIVVVNHGIWPVEDVAIADMDAERWKRTLDVNLNAAFYTCQQAARALRPDGRLIIVTSTAAQRGEAFHADYAASKGALVSLVKGFCVELAPRGITVNSVAPGWIDTEMAAPAMQGVERSTIEAKIPIGRVASPDDIAGPIVFLASGLARHITGEIVNVNGGAVLVG